MTLWSLLQFHGRALYTDSKQSKALSASALVTALVASEKSILSHFLAVLIAERALAKTISTDGP